MIREIIFFSLVATIVGLILVIVFCAFNGWESREVIMTYQILHGILFSILFSLYRFINKCIKKWNEPWEVIGFYISDEKGDHKVYI